MPERLPCRCWPLCHATGEVGHTKTPMPKTYVIDIRHYLDDRGELAQMPVPALAIALFCGAVVAWATGWSGRTAT